MQNSKDPDPPCENNVKNEPKESGVKSEPKENSIKSESEKSSVKSEPKENSAKNEPSETIVKNEVKEGNAKNLPDEISVIIEEKDELPKELKVEPNEMAKQLVVNNNPLEENKASIIQEQPKTLMKSPTQSPPKKPLSKDNLCSSSLAGSAKDTVKQINLNEAEVKAEKSNKHATSYQQSATTATTSASGTDRIETLSSEVSLGFGEISTENDDRNQTLVIRDGPEPYKLVLKTVCGYAIRCSHGRMPVQKVKDHQGYWLPYVYASENSKYLDTVNVLYDYFLNELKNVENPEISKSTGTQASIQDSEKSSKRKENVTFLGNIQLYNIYRFQIPDGQFITRYIFLAQWIGDNKCSPPISCCKDTFNIQWHPMDAIQNEIRHETRQLMDRFWGYEIVQTCATLYQQHQGNLANFSSPQIQEFNNNEVLKYLPRQSPAQGGQKSSSASFSQMLHEAKFAEKDVIKIYCDYVQHCYPSASMTFCSFFEYFSKIGFLQFDDTSLRHIFRAMNFKNKHFMLFNEFLLGLAALDSNAPTSKLRFTYIFRYYDRNSDGFLDEEDFRRMVSDIRYKANLSCDPNEIAADVKARLTALKLLDNSNRINFKTFLGEACHIGGIIHLFRTNKAILEAIHTRHAYELILNKSGKPFAPRLVGTCPKCRPKKYSLAYHTVKLNAQGRIDDPKALINLNCGEIDANLQFKQKADEMELRHSIEIVFNENSIANKVINLIRKMQDFNKMNRDRQKEVGHIVTSGLTTQTIVQLCKEVTDILMIEPRVLKVNTPCIVIGDIHGNINDLLTYEEQLWPLAPSANSPSFLFLGDYVDRGDYSIEVVAYLFAMKILAPTKFFLLRGNHEIRSIQRNFTFFKECMLKHGNKEGQVVFEAFNNTFDHLPLVGIIDEQIFCAHGGIPFSAPKIEDLYKIPMPLPEPEIQSKPAWEILWSDPITDEEYREVCQFHNQANDTGFADNIRRSTAYYFTEKALRNYFKANGLSHVIRAHELEIDGYRFHHSGLLITVFSSSRYCNSLNRSAAVFVDSRDNDGFIKVIALDT